MIPVAALVCSVCGYVGISAFCCCWGATVSFELSLPSDLLGSVSSEFVSLNLEFGHRGNGISHSLCHGLLLQRLEQCFLFLFFFNLL